jgi:hypothetical protein
MKKIQLSFIEKIICVNGLKYTDVVYRGFKAKLMGEKYTAVVYRAGRVVLM